jgi:hypothetical protein
MAEVDPSVIALVSNSSACRSERAEWVAWRTTRAG